MQRYDRPNALPPELRSPIDNSPYGITMRGIVTNQGLLLQTGKGYVSQAATERAQRELPDQIRDADEAVQHSILTLDEILCATSSYPAEGETNRNSILVLQAEGELYDLHVNVTTEDAPNESKFAKVHTYITRSGLSITNDLDEGRSVPFANFKYPFPPTSEFKGKVVFANKINEEEHYIKNRITPAKRKKPTRTPISSYVYRADISKAVNETPRLVKYHPDTGNPLTRAQEFSDLLKGVDVSASIQLRNLTNQLFAMIKGSEPTSYAYAQEWLREAHGLPLNHFLSLLVTFADGEVETTSETIRALENIVADLTTDPHIHLTPAQEQLILTLQTIPRDSMH